jgi:hypothetical protein
MFLVGLCVGLFGFNHTIYPLFCILPKFKKIYDITKYKPSILLYAILRTPVLWTFVLVCSTLFIMEFLPKYQIVYFPGLLVSLISVIIELPRRNVDIESLFMDSLKELFMGPKEDRYEKYSQYSVLQMRMADWRASTADVSPYESLSWECAACKKKNRLSKKSICLQGNGKRFIVRCETCNHPSIIRIQGILNYRLRTEARLPNYDTYKDGISKLIDLQKY